MNWKVTTAPTTEPVSLAEAKLHLRVDGSTEDSLILSLIKAARGWCEGYQNRSYVTQTVTLKRSNFPVYFELPRPPLISVTSIKYIDNGGTQQTVDAADYTVDTQSEPGAVHLTYGSSWPSSRGDVNGIEVIYVAGYGDASSVPESVKAAIKLIIGHLYENRELSTEASLNTIPFAAKSLLAIDRCF